MRSTEFADPAESAEASYSRHPVEDIEPAGEMEIDPALFEQVYAVAYKQAYRDCAERQLRVMQNAFLMLLSNNFSQQAFWEVCFGMGLPICEGRSMTELSVSLFLERQTISKGAKKFQRTNGLPINEYMKPAASHPELLRCQGLSNSMSDEHEISVLKAKQLAAQNLVGTINATYAECVGCDNQIRDLVIRKCNKARDCGILLQSYRKDCAHGSWESLFAREGVGESTFAFGVRTAQHFIKYARANPEPIIGLPEAVHSLWDHMVACGAIMPPQGHGEQQRGALTWLDRLSLTAGKVCEMFNGQVEKMGGDVRSLPPSERTALKMQIKPLVEIYERL